MMRLVSILILTSSQCFAQEQKVPVTIITPKYDSIIVVGKKSTIPEEKVTYEKFVKVSPGDVVLMVDGLNKLKELQMYDPKTTDKEKVENFKNIDAFVNRLQKTLRIDSLKIK